MSTHLTKKNRNEFHPSAGKSHVKVNKIKYMHALCNIWLSSYSLYYIRTTIELNIKVYKFICFMRLILFNDVDSALSFCQPTNARFLIESHYSVVSQMIRICSKSMNSMEFIIILVSAE